ncbi:hypothetical protein FA13DRAFT_1736176 [Coprinellus micaceus]|uniref:Glycosyl transferase CAP10 domain-containing protein n=1 Tax=Coprinellus micaceus TaxID=71717 RepID=A0A4Y7T1E2_COPMI|nr:hypothetical protein FA13DRAFT_1736176 [Coprinellus micaceus]
MKPASSRRITRIVLPFCALFLIFYLLPFPSVHGPADHDSEEAYHDPRPAKQPTRDDMHALPVIQEPPQPLKKEAPKPKPPSPLAKHKYRADGLLEVDVDGPHPIYELIADAEKKWKEKVNRQSQTLEAAVEEYRRRYKRAPPKGFELWWQYVKEHNVQLPDEYDQIHADLEPFWGVEPADLRKTQEELEKKKDSVSVIGLLREIEDYLPSFRATFSPHDGPDRLSDHGILTAALEAASSQTVLERSALPKVQGNGWRYACPPDSPARQRPVSPNHEPTFSSKKTLIHDHIKSMDPCYHTNHLLIHGQFIGHGNGPTPQAHLDVNPRSADPPFDEKPDERLLWRGRNTGIHHSPRSLWKNAHRDYFVRRRMRLKGRGSGRGEEGEEGRVNPALLDVAFAEEAVMCDPKTCDELERLYPFRPFQGTEEAGQYKYVFDIDGNGWSGRFKRLITSNALIFKATIYPEWYHDRVQPWVHYVPVQMDLSDLRIAERGREWSLGMWRREDLVAYFFRLILEWARLQSLDRDEMAFVLPEEGD